MQKAASSSMSVRRLPLKSSIVPADAAAFARIVKEEGLEIDLGADVANW
jgi:hypothetical protein